jgi:hypothetical protein
MPNFISFTSPGSGQFVIKAKTPSQASYFEKTFIISNNTTVIKFYAAGTTSPEIPQQDLVVGNFYDAYAFEADGTTPKDVEWSGVDIEFVAPFSFTADRRPIYQAAYAGQRTTDGGTITFGTNQQDYRKTPATGQSMTNPSTNGKLDWLNDKVIPTTTYGFERFHLTNIAGWTSYGTDNEQPHYPSNSYTGLSLTEAPYYNAMNSTVGADIQATPYTDTGLQSGTPGDNVEAWTAAVAALKTAAGVDAEITSYQGYRPVYTDSTMSTFIKTQLGYSKSSNNTAGWTGTGDSPGYCPEPGFDGSTETGISASIAKISGWFDEEFIGLQTIGFDGIGLDTGTRVFDNAAGRANGTVPGSIVNPDGTSSNALVDYFNSWGMKPVFEGVGLDTWTNGPGANAAPANDGRYADSAYWAFFGSWWGYSGTAGGETITAANFTTPSGGYISDTGVVGTAGNARAFTASEEVHCIFQWGTNTIMEDLMVGDPSVGTGTGIGWTGMKQIMWDFHNAGLVVSAAGSVTASVDGIPAADFFAYVSSLYTDPTQARPTSGSGGDWDTYQEGMGTIPDFKVGSNTITFDPSYPDTTGAFAYQFNGVGAGFGTTPFLYGPRSRFATVGDKANMPPYGAIYISAAEAASGLTGANAEGWYVFGPGVDESPGNSGYIVYAANPVAWPSTSNSADGLLGGNNGYSCHVVWLSNYTDATGSGGTDGWSAPPSNTDWDTYQLGMGTIPQFSTSSNVITYDPSYPDNAGGGATGMTQYNASNTGSGASPYTYAPRSRFSTDADILTMAPYTAIYCSAAEAASGGGTASTVEGWYVFGPGANDNPGGNGYQTYSTPVAWPTGANNDDGYISVNAGFVNNIVWLSAYTDAAGSGGTDAWTAP